MSEPPKTICRQIGESDLDGIADMLVRGFAERPRHYWTTGFDRMRHRDLPSDCPRYGMMLEHQGRPAGVMLMLFTVVEIDGEMKQRCNLSSWYVDPACSAYTGSLVLNALRRRDVTYTTISPAPFTLSTVEKVGFKRYTTGYVITAPALAKPFGRGVVHLIRDAEDARPFIHLAEHDLLVDHAAMACLSMVVEHAGEFHPFVFTRFKVRAGRLPLPIHQLIFCRDIAHFVRFAGLIGRWLLRRGSPLVAFDTDGADHGLPGFFHKQIGPKYFKGKDRPRLGDLAYSERVVFGP